MDAFAKNIRYLRRKSGHNQAELAKLVGKKQNTIANWENGISEPGIKELVILSKFFETSMDGLILLDLSQEAVLHTQNYIPSMQAGVQADHSDSLHGQPAERPATFSWLAQFEQLSRQIHQLQEGLAQINRVLPPNPWQNSSL